MVGIRKVVSIQFNPCHFSISYWVQYVEWRCMWIIGDIQHNHFCCFIILSLSLSTVILRLLPIFTRNICTFVLSAFIGLQCNCLCVCVCIGKVDIPLFVIDSSNFHHFLSIFFSTHSDPLPFTNYQLLQIRTTINLWYRRISFDLLQTHTAQTNPFNVVEMKCFQCTQWTAVYFFACLLWMHWIERIHSGLRRFSLNNRWL